MKHSTLALLTALILSGCTTTKENISKASESPKNNFDYVSFPLSTDQLGNAEDELVKRKWDALERDTAKKIEDLLVLDHGLSSTGRIEVIGCYTLKKSSELGNEGDAIFHIIQKDLMGSRLVWAFLVNSDNFKFQRLYPVSESMVRENIHHYKK